MAATFMPAAQGQHAHSSQTKMYAVMAAESGIYQSYSLRFGDFLAILAFGVQSIPLRFPVN
jgi:hypothetical protein